MILSGRDGDAPSEHVLRESHGSAPVLGISLLLSLSFVVVVCFYCFYSKSRKKGFADDEEESQSSTAEEHRNINDKKAPSMAAESRARKLSQWTRIKSLFQDASATEELNFSLRTSASNHGATNGDSSTTYDKSPMGEVRTSYVQPPSRDGRYLDSNPELAAPAKQTGNSFIPDVLKFEPQNVIAEETASSPESSEYVGRLEFSVAYSFDSMTLVVKIIKAADLPPMDLSGFSDPFVKCYLSPDRKKKLETKIRRKTLNPTWNETLLFEGLSYEKIQQRILSMQVMDWDRFSRNDPIGEILIPLNGIDLKDSRPQWKYLSPCRGSNKRGELLISLCYHPVESKIEIEIKQARNLKPMDINGTSDPYVKVWFLIRGKRMEKKKTVTVKNSLNPTFGEKFTFSSPIGILREIQLEVSVMDKDKIGRNEVIGKIYLGTKSNALEKRHWKEMLTNFRQPIEQWHILKV